MKDREETNRYTLNDLVARLKDEFEGVRVSERTIRSWISADLMPPPDGHGRGSHFGQEHLVRLQFIVRVRKRLGQRVPLQMLQDVMRTLDEEQIARVASGEEPVRALTLDPHGTQLAGSDPSTSKGLAAFVVNESSTDWAQSPPPKRRQPVSRSEPYTTIDVADGIQLRMKGDEPDKVATLAQLARKLREWMTDGG